MPMIVLRDYVLQKQAEWGREILIKDIASATGLSRDTVSRMWNGKVRNASEDTLFALCQFFGVPKGEPIPFVRYDP
jgi:transcriptional regulator with XRE-family HTH domain